MSQKIDTAYDEILGVNYDLVKFTLSELKTLAKTWYEGINLTEFDHRYYQPDRDEKNIVTMKKAGLICNYFFAYREGDKTYLLDGFNRLFTDYGKLDNDPVVYLKLITDKLEDHRLIEVMYRLNQWKLNSGERTNGGFKIDGFIDRGFSLLLFAKFNIKFYYYDRNVTDGWYEKRIRNNEDIPILDHYFILEHDFAGYFKTSYSGVEILLSQPNVINDFKAILEANNYRDEPFKNYKMFLEGYVMYLAHLRYKKYDKPIKFDYFLDALKKDKAFSKKLPSMSGTDSTRKNIYHFYRNLDKDLLVTK